MIATLVLLLVYGTAMWIMVTGAHVRMMIQTMLILTMVVYQFFFHDEAVANHGSLWILMIMLFGLLCMINGSLIVNYIWRNPMVGETRWVLGPIMGFLGPVPLYIVLLAWFFMRDAPAEDAWNPARYKFTGRDYGISIILGAPGMFLVMPATSEVSTNAAVLIALSLGFFMLVANGILLLIQAKNAISGKDQ